MFVSSFDEKLAKDFLLFLFRRLEVDFLIRLPIYRGVI